MSHPTLKDWEDGKKNPAPPFRAAIEVWTGGGIKALEWPASQNERAIVKHAARVEEARASSTAMIDDDGTDEPEALNGTDSS